MHKSHDSEVFSFYLDLLIDTLKLQNEALVKSIKDFLITLLGREYSRDIFTAAVFQLAETEPDSCRWFLRTFSALNCLELTEGVIMFSVKKLIGKGFILGQDFSVTPTGEIVITKNAQKALMEGSSASNRLFLEEISQVID